MNKITALLLLLLIMPFSAHSMDPPGACALPAASEVTEVDATEGAVESADREELSESQRNLLDKTETEANKHIQITSQSRIGKDAALSRAASSDGLYKTENYVNIPAKPNQYAKYIDVQPEVEQGTGSTFTFKENQKEAYLNEVNRKYIEAGGRGDALNPKTRQLISNYMEEGPDPINNPGVFSSNEGMPGFHAEVRATNRLFNMSDELAAEEADVATFKLSGKVREKGAVRLPTEAFKACANCSGILKPSGINILTEPKS